jgi:hypothetical protein
MRALTRTVLVSVGLSLIACSSTRVAERDGCWVKRTEGAFGSGEQIGFCTREPPAVAVADNDRLTRLVLVCLAQANHRWENQALAAWNHDQPIPPQADDAQVVRACMTEVATALGLEAENTALKSRLAELGQDRDALKTSAERDRQFLQQNSDKMVTALGEAAKKPAPAATATASVKSETELKSQGSQAAPPTTVVGVAPPAAAPVVVSPSTVLQAPGGVTSTRLPAGRAPAAKVSAPPQNQPLVPVRPSSSACPERKSVKKATGNAAQKDAAPCEEPVKPSEG